MDYKHSGKLEDIISFDEYADTTQKATDLLEFIEDKSFSNMKIRINKDAIYLINGDNIRSAIGTLDSILTCCRQGHFADANLLVRKYRDDLFQYLYIVEVTNNTKGLNEEEMKVMFKDDDFFNNMFKAVIKTHDILVSGERKDVNDIAVDAFFSDEAESGNYFKYLDSNNYLKYLRKNQIVNECIEEHSLLSIWLKINRRLNNYAHSNGSKFIKSNSVLFYRQDDLGVALLNEIQDDIEFITTLFLVILTLINPPIIGSSDYVDYLDMGQMAPDNSQYWIASIVQNYIDIYVKKLNTKLKSYLVKNTYMHIK